MSDLTRAIEAPNLSAKRKTSVHITPIQVNNLGLNNAANDNKMLRMYFVIKFMFLELHCNTLILHINICKFLILKGARFSCFLLFFPFNENLPYK